MKVLYYNDPEIPTAEPSIFLAGPTPRQLSVKSWRRSALEILKENSFTGTIFIPELNKYTKEDYDRMTGLDVIDWEWKRLESACVVLFWIPRELETMPAFNTNIEWGMLFKDANLVLGFPETAVKMEYIQYCALRYRIPNFNNLEDTVLHSISLAKGIHQIRNPSA